MAATKPKKVPKKQAFENAKKLREVMRAIYRACNLDPQHGGSSSPQNAAIALASARTVTNLNIEVLGEYHRNQLKVAIEHERQMAAQAGVSGHLHVMVKQAYELVQKLPSWDGLPEGEADNKLRAIEALIKNSAASGPLLNSIRIIIDPQKYIDTMPEPAVPKPQKPKMPEKPAAVPHPETGLPVSAVNLTQVVKGGGIPWGYHVLYYGINKGQPMTWGECAMWVDKGHKKPGKPGDKYYVHPDYATPKQKEYHESTAPLHATVEEVELDLTDEGSEDDGEDEGVF